MKKNRRRTLSLRLLALVLCLACALGAAPLSAIATETETEPVPSESTEVTPAPSEDTPTLTGLTEGTGDSTDTTVTPGTPETTGTETGTPTTDATGEPIPAGETTPEVPQTLYERILACTTVEEVNNILNNLTEEDEAEMEVFSPEQQDALEAHLAEIGYYDGELLAYRYTIQKDDSQSVTVDNMLSDGFSYEIDPTSNYITISTTTSGYGNNKKTTGYKISVGSWTTAGDYTVTVKYRTGSNNNYTETEETFIIHVIEKQDSWEKYYSQNYYANPAPEHVAWDVVASYTGTKPSKGADNATNYVESVQINGKNVTQADSDDTYAYKNQNTGFPGGGSGSTTVKRAGETLDTYFGDDITMSSPSTDAVLTITPKAGYYITGYWIVCTNGSTAYNCAVLSDGNEHHASFKFSDTMGGAVEDTVWSEYFGHPDSRDDQYFILVSVAPVPTPLFVEYDYGIIEDGVAEDDKSIFTTPTSWTTTTSGNVYGTGKIDTDNTQYRYTYNAGSPSEAASWKHYANSVTNEAKNAAWNAGYYFAGWKAEYYTDATEKSIRNDPDGRNYDYNMTGKYADERTYNEGDNVTLLMHVKLTAQWNPIELKLTKTVTGLTDTDFASEAHTYKIQVQKKNDSGGWENFGEEQSLTVTGDGSASVTLSPITPGTYRAVEVKESRGNLTKDGKTMYVTVTDSSEVTYNTTPGETRQTLTVTNAYTATAPAYDLTIKKTVSGNMYNDTKQFAFTVSYTDKDGNSQTATLNLAKDGQGTVSDIKVGTTVTVVENPEGYDYSFTSISPTTNTSDVNDEEKGTKGISFTMPAQDTTVVFNNENNANIDTGVILDALPYVLILAIVAGGVVLMLLQRRRSYED